MLSAALLLAVTASAGTAAVRLRLAELGIPQTAVIAHRGASALAPEQSREAFVLAHQLGADYLEADMRLTKDGAVILNHDDTFARTTDVAEVFPGREHDPVDAFTRDEVSRLRLKGRPDLSVLSLEQLLELAKGPGVYLEAKSFDGRPETAAATAEAAVAVLERGGWLSPGKRGKVILESFSPEAVRTFKRLAPATPAALLAKASLTHHPRYRARILDHAVEIGADIVAPRLFPHAYRSFVREAHARGLAVHSYTFNDVKVLGRTIIPARWLAFLFVRWGRGDGFFTNHAEQFLRRP